MSSETEELKQKIINYEQIVQDFERRKKRFLEWVDYVEPNPVFKKLYKRKFLEIFEGIRKKV